MDGSTDETIGGPASSKQSRGENQTLAFSDASNDSAAAGSFTTKSFGDYELLEEIARGGMGVVYQARQRSLQRTVALKMILSGQFAAQSDVLRFRQEAAAAASLDHPGIVPIYEIGEHDGHHFFSMKLIEGGSLSERLPELRKDTRLCVSIIAKIATALHHAHQRGILHRDIKPANILMDTDGTPMVSDLGLAKDTRSDSGITHTGAVVGTPAYMSPEQASGHKDITTAADVYSIGAILYEVLTGLPPHKGESAMETLRKVIEEDPATPRSLASGVDRTLQLICMKCLHKDPNQRYASAAALADDLQRWLGGDRVSVRPRSWASTLSEFVISNARSALGAIVIGVLAGLAFGYCLSVISSSSEVRARPPSAVFASMQRPLPTGRSLVFVNEMDATSDMTVMPLFVGVLTYIGLFVAIVARPKSASAAFAIGLLTALVMTITVTACQTSFIAIASGIRNASFDDIEFLAQAALNPTDQESTTLPLHDRFPALKNVVEEDQAAVLATYIHYNNVFAVPLPMIFALVVAAIFCVLPCTCGTTYATKLLHQKGRWWSVLIRCWEFGLLLAWLSVAFFLFTVIAVTPNANGPFELSALRQGFFYVLLIFIIIGIYRQTLRWYWRLPLYIALFFGLYFPT